MREQRSFPIKDETLILPSLSLGEVVEQYHTSAGITCIVVFPFLFDDDGMPLRLLAQDTGITWHLNYRVQEKGKTTINMTYRV